MFKQGTYVTNGKMCGVVSDYTDDYVNGRFIHFYVSFNNVDKNTICLEKCELNDGSFREMNETEINEFNQTLLKCGYIWDADSMKVTDLKALK